MAEKPTVTTPKDVLLSLAQISAQCEVAAEGWAKDKDEWRLRVALNKIRARVDLVDDAFKK